MTYRNNIVIVEEVSKNKEASELNFQNEDAIEQKELADQDLIVAKHLLDNSERSDDIRITKACDRKAVQMAQEAVEKYQKSVIYADDEHKKITNENLRKKLEKTHNTKFLQRETRKVGIHILKGKDIDTLNKPVEKKPGEKSPYNAIRFSRQNIRHENAKNAVAIAEKAKKKLERMIEDQKRKKIRVGNWDITFNF